MEEVSSIIPASKMRSKKRLNLPDPRVLKQITRLSKIPRSYAFIWFGTSTASALIIITLLINSFTTLPKVASQKYSIFASKPLVLGKSTERILGRDSRASVLNEVFESYDCPLTGMGDTFVSEADKHDIPYWLVAAVSFQESNCGKKTPGFEGSDSYNAWGWGVWGDNVKGFDDWEDGVETVSEYFSEKFYSNGVTDLCTIMKTYTPPSKGSWCNGVAYFRDRIVHYESD